MIPVLHPRQVTQKYDRFMTRKNRVDPYLVRLERSILGFLGIPRD